MTAAKTTTKRIIDVVSTMLPSLGAKVTTSCPLSRSTLDMVDEDKAKKKEGLLSGNVNQR